MNQNMRLNQNGIVRIKMLLEDIRRTGKTHICPSWDEMLEDPIEYRNKCKVCKEYFPNIKNECPCNWYSPEETIHFLENLLEEI